MATSLEPVRRRTRQRAVVLAAVRASGVEHPTAEAVFARVRRELPRISLGTVYRNLQRLVAEGQIGVTQLNGRVTRYDPEPGGHAHFVCERCGHIEDLPAPRWPAGVQAAERAGHLVHRQSLVLHGRCARCRDGGDA
jgi:Fur family transcriptional regulator, peroxide stress response regulator